jgi:GTP-dependent phosphoenolpyruvate carboxykinase
MSAGEERFIINTREHPYGRWFIYIRDKFSGDKTSPEMQAEYAVQKRDYKDNMADIIVRGVIVGVITKDGKVHLENLDLKSESHPRDLNISVDKLREDLHQVRRLINYVKEEGYLRHGQ